MAVPKGKTSKQRRNTRAANWKLTAPNLSACSNCGEAVQGHRVCANCGYYDGRPVVFKKQK